MLQKEIMISEVLFNYGLSDNATIYPFGDGLINNTWRVEDGNNIFILQKINTAVFKHPEYILENIEAVGNYLSTHFPEYFFCKPCKTINGDGLVYIKDEGHFRLFPFIKNSHTINVAANTDQAFEASRKFGEFTKLLSAFPAHELKITLPDFHNISLRYKDFLTAVAEGNETRREQSAAAYRISNQPATYCF